MSAAAVGGSRRDLVRCGLALAGVALGPGLLMHVRAAGAEEGTEATLLNAAVELERRAAATYEAGLASGLLGGAASELAELLRDQARAHAGRLAESLDDLGQSLPSRPAPQPRADRWSSEADVLDAAITVETAVVAAYHEAIERLEDGGLLRLAGQIMAVDAQHLVVLREALGRRPLGGAFVTGASRR